MKTEDEGRKTGDGGQYTGGRMTGDRKGMYKFQKLRVYQKGLGYLNLVYELADKLPESENYNLKSQLIRAATSIVLNIAEGSTGQSNAEQARFLSIALRSYLETIACFDIALNRKCINESDLKKIKNMGHELFVSLIGMKKKVLESNYSVKEDLENYGE